MQTNMQQNMHKIAGWSAQDVTAKYWSDPARNRDLIREIKQSADDDWDLTYEQWLEFQGYECK
jgi:hypothetical protein